MGAAISSKAEVRQMVWRALEVQGAARLPGIRGRIPNFVGVELAALHVGRLPEWQRAGVVKVSADAPLLPVRRMALREGKVLYVGVPRLPDLECFIELDPARLGSRAASAASIATAERLGRRVAPEQVPRIELVVCGAVAVNGRGARVGKGSGCSDLEYGLLAELGLVDGGTLIVTAAHDLQLVPQTLPMEPHDLPVDVVATPDGSIRLTAAYPRPAGIYLQALSRERLAEVPVVRRLVDRR